jgi:hypothetical protein
MELERLRRMARGIMTPTKAPKNGSLWGFGGSCDAFCRSIAQSEIRRVLHGAIQSQSKQSSKHGLKRGLILEGYAETFRMRRKRAA